MKPYIEYKGKTYEFEANFELQKNFKKEYRKLLSNKKSNLMSAFENDEYNMNEIAVVQKEMEELKKELDSKHLPKEETEKLIEQKTFEILSKYPKVLKLLTNDNDSNLENSEELNEKYCRLMFERKYQNEKEIFDEMINEICIDKGIEYVEQLFSSIIETVFTSVVREAPLQKHSFAWETNKAN